MARSNLKGDVTGALSAAFFTIPLSIGYGLLAFAPLGTDFLPIAALLGIYAGIFAGFFAPLFGGTKIQVTCPEAAMTLILASFVAAVAANPQIAPGPSKNVIIVGLAALCVMTGGLIQLIFGVLRLGDIVKYVPYPLISGFMNGIALLLILKQVRPLLGITGSLPLREVAGNFSLVQPLTL
nr:hypothetical protein [Deltaproteobacteria bacterium]NIO16682.1 hypothetical protein [Deltaproteobacteria bacterium]NIS77393.1 hypothetical protein [Deltaproteobacteria bacterium]